MDEKTDKLLDNNIYFTGTLIYMKASNNHTYGIVRVKIDSSNVKSYYKQSDSFIFPYRIENDIAEVYTYVPILSGLVYNKTKVIVDSNNRLLEYITNTDTIKGDLFVYDIPWETDRKFVEKNTIFNK